MNNMPKNKLIMIPLGGVGEIGLNFYLYGYNDKWLIVDCGIGFAGDAMPGIDLLLPDHQFVKERASDVVAMVITHAHLDHIGAISYFWRDIKCPIYARKFTMEMLEGSLDERGLLGKVPLNTVEKNAELNLDPFSVRFVPINHSIPDTSCLLIKAGKDKVFHTGDWMFDDSPLLGDKPDYKVLEEIGGQGIDAFLCDSTQVFKEKEPGSEAAVRKYLTQFISARKTGRIIVTAFSTNIMRITSIAKAAVSAGRRPVLAGRSLWNSLDAAVSCGYIDDPDSFLTPEEADDFDPEKLVYICTGSQGEPRSALLSIAGRSHRHIKVAQGDVVIFSSRVIPGNEIAIKELQNRLVSRGAEVVTQDTDPVHVSGHASRTDIRKMLSMIKPKLVIPVHGEDYHLTEMANLAKSQGYESLVIDDGQVVEIAGGHVINRVPTAVVAIDGKRLVPMDSDILKKRRKVIYGGAVVITIVVDNAGNILGRPKVSAIGLFDQGSIENDALADKVKDAVDNMPDDDKQNDQLVAEAVRQAARKYVLTVQGNKPVTEVHLVRV